MERALVSRRCSQRRQQRMEPLLEPVVATGGNRLQIAPATIGESKRDPLPWVATGCRKERVVRRGSTVRVRKRTLQKRRTLVLSRSGRLAPGRTCGGSGALYGAFSSRSRSAECRPVPRVLVPGDQRTRWAVSGRPPRHDLAAQRVRRSSLANCCFRRFFRSVERQAESPSVTERVP